MGKCRQSEITIKETWEKKFLDIEVKWQSCQKSNDECNKKRDDYTTCISTREEIKTTIIKECNREKDDILEQCKKDKNELMIKIEELESYKSSITIKIESWKSKYDECKRDKDDC